MNNSADFFGTGEGVCVCVCVCVCACACACVGVLLGVGRVSEERDPTQSCSIINVQ